jgi:hypothetical protein
MKTRSGEGGGGLPSVDVIAETGQEPHELFENAKLDMVRLCFELPAQLDLMDGCARPCTNTATR